MGRYFRLGWVYLKVQLKKTWVFRSSFFINRIAQFCNYAVDFLLIWIVVNAFQTMNGWTRYEVMALYAVSLTGYGLAGIFFFRTMGFVMVNVMNGGFDDILVKPVQPLPFICFQHINPDYIAHFLLAAIMLVTAFVNLGISLSVLGVLQLFGAFLCGGLVFGGMFLIAMGGIFLSTKLDNLQTVLFVLRDASYYPVSLYPVFLQIIMSVILPYAAINFFPIQSLLGKNDFLMFGPAMAWIAPLIATTFFAIGIWFFHFGMSRYKSSGS
jgi:ABC-2 type transport system permease protein